KWKEVLLLTAWAFIPLIISAEFAKVFTTRYVLYIFPYLAILTASTFHTFKGSTLQGVRRVSKFILIIFVVHALFIDLQLLTNIEVAPLPRSERSGYLEEWTAGQGIEQVASYIRGEYLKNRDQKIVVGTEGYFGTLPDGLQIYLNDLQEIIVIGTGLDFKQIPQSLIESKQAGNKTYFVVNSTRILADYKKLDLKLIAEYPKAIRPDGSRESLYFFEVLDD
ncbi:hypothetical protein KKB40_05665, partial [Patescibacteria group bacterium]|nr:hypothetical protein [Patescibacteria group bacterium]